MPLSRAVFLSCQILGCVTELSRAYLSHECGLQATECEVKAADRNFAELVLCGVGARVTMTVASEYLGLGAAFLNKSEFLKHGY